MGVSVFNSPSKVELFSKMVVPIYSIQHCIRVPAALHPYQHLIIFRLLEFFRGKVDLLSGTASSFVIV